MRTRNVLCLLLSFVPGSAAAEPPVTAAAMRVEPGMQRERDDARKTILEDELASEARQLADAQKACAIAERSSGARRTLRSRRR